MFRKTEPKLPLYEVDNVLRGMLPADDWSYTYRKMVYPLIDEDKFKHLFSEEQGAPNKPIKILVSLLIFMGLEKLTWREVVFQFERRVDWLNALHVWIGDNHIHHSTLFKFYQRLESDNTAYEFFQEITKTFTQLCGTSVSKQRVDSFYIHGWLKKLSRYGLFKETLYVFLSDLQANKPGLYHEAAPNLSRNYLEKSFDITEKDKEETHRRIELMATDLYYLKNQYKDHKQVQHYDSFKILSGVFDQQCEVIESQQDNDSALVIQIREKPQGEDIISSPHNPEARYVTKGKQHVCGDKAFISETCDKNNETQFITDVTVTDSTHADVNEVLARYDRLESGDLKPAQDYADAGFVCGKTINEAADRNIELQGPSSGRSQSFEQYNTQERPLDIADFEVTVSQPDNELIIESCPAEQIPVNQKFSAKTEKWNVHFDAKQCEGCKRKERCIAKIGKRIATVTFDKDAYAGAVRHHRYMKDKDYRKECGTRAGAEALVSELVRAHGLRKSRHRRQSRTKLQLIFGGIAVNVKRFIRHQEKSALMDRKSAQNQ